VTEAEGVRIRAVDGRRSTQEMGRAVFAAAARAADPVLAEEIERTREWRKRYPAPVRGLVGAGARSSEAALGIARAGLTRLHERVELGPEGVPLTEVGRSAKPTSLRTEVVTGSQTTGSPELAIPYAGDVLRGDAIRRQLDGWVERRIIEPSCREAVEKVLANPDWLDLSDRRFVIFGAASEMGPLEALTAWGADVVAVDLPERRVWERILATAREGRGSLSVPVRGGGSDDLAGAAGADLLRDTAEITGWLAGFDAPFTILDDAYAPGSSFVLVAAASDALMSTLAERAGVSLAYLASPTDAFAVPEEIAVDARSRRRAHVPARAMSGGALYRPAYRELASGEDGRRWGIVDCLVPQQGANYALAKNLQRWRAVAARDRGVTVSANVAPATWTRSVTRNRVLAAAYRGASAFGVEIFRPETSRWLMAALLVRDLREGGSPPLSEHPYDLHAEGAAHGGIWRLPYEPRSVLPLAVARGLLRRG
jgi:hypothetical protein